MKYVPKNRPLLTLPAALLLFAVACAAPQQQIQPESEEKEPELKTEEIPAELHKPPVKNQSIISFVTPRGQPVTLNVPSDSESIGTPVNGRLANARCMRAEGPGFIHPSNASCGTDETVMLTMFAVGELLRDYPETVPVLIGSLSAPEGGPLKPHKSHQSGRDIDIGLFARGNVAVETFGALDQQEIDFEKTLTLLVNLIATGRVQFIFINYSIQPSFVEAAKAQGYDKEQIDYLFQYPKGKDARQGIIRHANGHTRHAHVRFTCPQSDTRCAE